MLYVQRVLETASGRRDSDIRAWAFSPDIPWQGLATAIVEDKILANNINFG